MPTEFDDDCQTYASIADAALDSFVSKFWDPNTHYLISNFCPQSPTITDTSYWNYAEGFDAIVDGARRTSNSTFLQLLPQLFEGQKARGFGRPYFDDENWMILALLRAYELSNNTQMLDAAQTLMSDIMENAWDETCCGNTPGGNWWDTAHTQKATASNGGPVIAAVMLYQLAGCKNCLAFAEKVYSFWWQHMVNPTTHQVADHIDTQGQLTWWKFTYNEGLMIGAGVYLWRATANESYLENSHLVAGYMIANEIANTSAGASVLYDGTSTSCTGDCAQFKGPAFRYLLELYATDPARGSAYYAVLKNSVDSIWNNARQPSNDLFSIDWRGPAPAAVSCVGQAETNAAVMALQLFAEFSCGEQTY